MILPIPSILFQIMCLLMSIVIEAYVFHLILKYSRPMSVRYSVIINLASTIVGWISFFIIQNVLPNSLKAMLIEYIFFNRIQAKDLWLFPIPAEIIVIACFVFMGTFMVEFLTFKLFQRIDDPKYGAPITKHPNPAIEYFEDIPFICTIKNRANLPGRIFVANAYSYGAILVVVLLRNFL